jgi:putative membrane protein
MANAGKDEDVDRKKQEAGDRSGEVDEKTRKAEQRTEWAEERTEMAEERTEQAESRTDWAKHRTVLANERTFSAWLRTGLSAMGGGVAVAELLGTDDTTIIARILGVILIALGASVILVAVWRYTNLTNFLEAEGLPVTPKWMAFSLAGGLMLGAILVLIIIFMQ